MFTEPMRYVHFKSFAVVVLVFELVQVCFLFKTQKSQYTIKSLFKLESLTCKSTKTNLKSNAANKLLLVTNLELENEFLWKRQKCRIIA